YESAKSDVAELESLNDAVTAAIDWFEDNGYVAPVDLTDGGSVNGTIDNDIFLFSTLEGNDSSTIGKFGDAGVDYLFIGEGYTLVDLGEKSITDKVGSETDFEVFF